MVRHMTPGPALHHVVERKCGAPDFCERDEVSPQFPHLQLKSDLALRIF
jgi:hypothetical protein